MDTNGIPDDNQMDTQDSINKNSRDKKNINKSSLEKKNKEKNNLVETKEDISLLSVNDAIIKDVIEYLNKKVNTSYNWENDNIKKLIYDLIEKGYRKIDFQLVIDKKYDEWHDDKMVVHLTPYTLFGKNFENYLNQPVRKKTIKDIPMEVIDEMLKREQQNGIINNTVFKMLEDE